MGVIPMSQGDSCSGRRGGEAANTGNNREGDARGFQHGHLLTSAPEDEWVSTLESTHDVAVASVLDHQIMDVGLLLIFMSEPLAGIDDESIRTRFQKHVGMY